MTYTPVALRSAYTIVKWAKEHEKKNDLDRDPGFQDRDEPRLKKGLEVAERVFSEPVDKKVLSYYIGEAAKLPEGHRIRALDPVLAGLSGTEAQHANQEFVEKLYEGTKVTRTDERMKMFGMTSKELAALGDPMIDFAIALEAQRKELEDKTDVFDGALQRLRPKLQQLRQAHSGALLYPDANGTIRLSVGEVRGYAPRDAVSYGFQTRLDGIIEKNTGEEPFDCPEGLFKLRRAKDFGRYADPVLQDVPVCLLSTDDITGGNSGSPILNGKGDCIGVIFDGNLEAVSADYHYMPDLTRAISVDARYILFVVDKFAGAKELLGEMTVR
jgi:hypothetical protein